MWSVGITVEMLDVHLMDLRESQCWTHTYLTSLCWIKFGNDENIFKQLITWKFGNSKTQNHNIFVCRFELKYVFDKNVIENKEYITQHKLLVSSITLNAIWLRHWILTPTIYILSSWLVFACSKSMVTQLLSN